MQMHKNKSVIILLVLVGVLLCACSSPEVSIVNLPEIPQPPVELPANRVEAAYFHMPQRCVTCICFEQRADYVVRTYFQDELASGELTFKIYAIGEKANVAAVKRYNALGSQLFINMVMNNVDHIKDIQDIWDWHCTGDKPGFDVKVKTIIEKCLEAVK